MRIKIVLAALVLAAAPGLAFANGCSSHGREANMSCGEGTTWDASSQSCVPNANS